MKELFGVSKNGSDIQTKFVEQQDVWYCKKNLLTLKNHRDNFNIHLDPDVLPYSMVLDYCFVMH